ncbi:aminotransferase class I/II-fold pyridoxal phosphate-dependent enzyme [Fulvivirgaceae bacterium BMA10]|uniref:O-succinylhomoserine sulfhydrylase n=1 Tax=Splendidivirga corallicola TaxID=3051826 RepID=A0ABT8KYM2_9BACT|nr:aminotransferase class I/II-fold pyridoxal phosphate-dependent enzyme [Fulvivirgaceae bacterium BMA10]
MNFETQAIRTQNDNSLYREHSTPIYMTSSFVFENAEEARALFADEIEGNIYTRYSNPTNNEFVEKLCLMEGTEDGIATASGMAAMFSSIAALVESGDHILACRSVFGSTHQILTKILPKWGISHTYADINKPEEWENLIQKNTKMIFVETPSNPGLDLLDLEWLGKLANKHNLILNVDNCFATPYLQQPAKFGAHIVTHSATKFIDGQGRTIGGAILGSKELIQEIRFFARHSGPALSPFNGWLLSKSLETLAVRMEKHCENALKIAEYLDNHQELELVKYPFLKSHPKYELAKKQMKHGGGLLTFVVKGGLERGRNFLDNLKLLSLTPNLGDTRTTVTHPASTTHSKLTDEERLEVGIVPGLVRISVGLENVNDILEDIENALRASKIKEAELI